MLENSKTAVLRQASSLQSTPPDIGCRMRISLIALTQQNYVKAAQKKPA